MRVIRRKEKRAHASSSVQLGRYIEPNQISGHPRVVIRTFDPRVSNMHISRCEIRLKATDSGATMVNYVIVELDKIVYHCKYCDTMSNATIPFQFECIGTGDIIPAYRMKITSMTDQKLIGNFILQACTRRIFINRPYDEDRQLLLYPRDTIIVTNKQEEQSAKTMYNEILENKEMGCCYTIKIESGVTKTLCDRYCTSITKVESPSSIHPTDNMVIRDQTKNCIAYGLPTYTEYKEVDFKLLEGKSYTIEWKVAIIPKRICVAI